MKDKFVRFAGAYIGWSQAHKQFVKKLALYKVLVFPAFNYVKEAIDGMEKRFNDTQQAPSIAVVTNPISLTQFQAIVLSRNEFALVAEDRTELEKTLLWTIFCDIWRVFDDFRIDLAIELTAVMNLSEIDRSSIEAPRKLSEYYRNILKRSLWPNQLDDLNQNQVQQKVALFRFLRNVIEHSDGIVSQRSIREWSHPQSKPPFQEGESIVVGAKEVGELISFTETIASGIDERAAK